MAGQRCQNPRSASYQTTNHTPEPYAYDAEDRRQEERDQQRENAVLRALGVDRECKYPELARRLDRATLQHLDYVLGRLEQAGILRVHERRDIRSAVTIIVQISREMPRIKKVGNWNGSRKAA